VADYTAAWISVISAAVGATSAIIGQIILMRSQTGREQRAAQHVHNLQKRAELKPVYRRVLDAADAALATAQQKAFYQGNEMEEELDKRHLAEIHETAQTFQAVRNDLIMESGSSEVMTALNEFWDALTDYLARYENWVEVRRLNRAGVMPAHTNLKDASNELWGRLPEVVAAHGTLQERIREHLVTLEQP
jgi:hypothetical protein